MTRFSGNKLSSRESNVFRLSIEGNQILFSRTWKYYRAIYDRWTITAYGLITLWKNNTIRCKKFATIITGQKNIARPFFKQKQVSMSAEMYSNLCILALVLTCFRLKKGRATFFQPKTIVESSFKVIFYNT